MDPIRGAGEVQLFSQNAKYLELTHFHRVISYPDGIHPINLLDEYKRSRHTFLIRRRKPLIPAIHPRRSHMRLPLSLRKRNCSQEAGSVPARLTVNIRAMESQFP